MGTGNKRKRIEWVPVFAILAMLALFTALLNGSAPGADDSSGAGAQKSRSYVVLAWNNLGMHCYNPDFSNLAVLPPSNVLWAQVIKVGDPPQFVTDGITVEYRFPGNTYSVGKTNFWDFAQQIFHLSAPLPPNIGLTGKGLSGTMDLVRDATLGDHFVAAGIPLTEYYDKDKKLRDPDPYQLAQITVRDVEGKILAKTHRSYPRIVRALLL